MDLSKYSYQDLVKLGKDYGISGNNMKREDLEKLIYTRIENDSNKDFVNPEQTPTKGHEEKNDSSSDSHEHYRKTHGHKTYVFETNSHVEFNVNGEKKSGTRFEFDNHEIYADRKRIVEENYGKEIFK